MAKELGKDKIFWTNSMNLKLVKFIRAKRFIWNSKHPKYTSSDLRERAYAAFGRRYGSEFSGDVVKQRWTNIRSTFAHYSRKLKAAQEAGEEFQVQWHLWDACQFLRNSNMPLHKLNLDSDAFSPIQNNQSSEESDSEQINKKPITSNQIDCNEFSQQLVNVFKNFQNDAFGLDNSKNAAVGKAVAKKLSNMNSFEAANVCHKISGILLLYDDLNPNNPNSRMKSEQDFSDFDESD